MFATSGNRRRMSARILPTVSPTTFFFDVLNIPMYAMIAWNIQVLLVLGPLQQHIGSRNYTIGASLKFNITSIWCTCESLLSLCLQNHFFVCPFLCVNAVWPTSYLILKGLSHLGKSCEIYSNRMSKCWERSTCQVWNFFPKILRISRDIWGRDAGTRRCSGVLRHPQLWNWGAEHPQLHITKKLHNRKNWAKLGIGSFGLG